VQRQEKSLRSLLFLISVVIVLSIRYGAHEDASWRFSVVVAAQAAPSNPAVSRKRRSHQDARSSPSQHAGKNKKLFAASALPKGTAFRGETPKWNDVLSVNAPDSGRGENLRR
jgi:hypothetical protein